MERPSVSKKKTSTKAVGKSVISDTDTEGQKLNKEAKPLKNNKKSNIAAKSKSTISKLSNTTLLKQEIEALKLEIETLKEKEANLKLELLNKTRNNNYIPPTLLKEFADMSDDIRNLKTDILDSSNNIFQLHKVVKDIGYSVENKVGRLFLRFSLLVIIIAVVISFLIIYWQLNLSNPDIVQ